MVEGVPAGSVDFHVHVFRTRDVASEAGRRLMEGSNPRFSFGPGPLDEFLPLEDLHAELDAAGIERAVVLPQETPGVDIEVPTDYVLDYCRRSGRLVPFASVNPVGDPDPAGRLRRLADAGARGLKLYPSYQFFFPNDAVAYRVYEAAGELGWPVVFHTGSSIFPRSRLKYALPVHLDDVAVDFPDLRIVLAHAGRPAWTAEATVLARTHANVYLDVSGLPPKNLLRYLPDLPRLTAKAVFGSDWPSTPRLPDTVAGVLGLGLDAAQLDQLFRTTAESLLGPG